MASWEPKRPSPSFGLIFVIRLVPECFAFGKILGCLATSRANKRAHQFMTLLCDWSAVPADSNVGTKVLVQLLN